MKTQIPKPGELWRTRTDCECNETPDGYGRRHAVRARTMACVIEVLAKGQRSDGSIKLAIQALTSDAFGWFDDGDLEPDLTIDADVLYTVPVGGEIRTYRGKLWSDGRVIIRVQGEVAGGELGRWNSTTRSVSLSSEYGAHVEPISSALRSELDR